MSEESKRVLELDERATPGEWTWINVDSSISRAGRLFGNGQLIIDAEPGIFYDNIKDITLIAEYRTLAPQLARQVEALEAKVNNRVKLIEILRDALRELLALKDFKDKYGKVGEYNERQPKAWEDARAAFRVAGGVDKRDSYRRPPEPPNSI